MCSGSDARPKETDNLRLPCCGELKGKRRDTMSEKMIENNKVSVIGKIVSGFTFSHEVFGEGFYMVDLEVNRLSEQSDIIPLMISNRLIKVDEDYQGCTVEAVGQGGNPFDNRSVADIPPVPVGHAVEAEGQHMPRPTVFGLRPAEKQPPVKS